MDKVYEIIITFVIEQFHKWYSLIMLMFLASFIILLSTQFVPENITNYIFICTILVINLLIFITWIIISRRLIPTLFCPSNKIGIIIAIQESSNEKYEELKFNFIEQILSQLNNDNFWVKILNYKDCRKVQKDSDAKLILKKTKSNMIIYGKSLNDLKDIKLDLKALLSHPIIPEELQKQLEIQLSELLPRVAIDKSELIDGFSITSQWLSFYSSYFVGLATLWSRNFDKAQDIFECIINDISKINRGANALLVIKKNSTDVLFEIYLLKANIKYNLFSKSRDIEDLKQSRIFLKLSNKLRPNNESYFILEPVFLFLLEREVLKARLLLQKISDVVAQKHYSLAFLAGYECKIDSIFKIYKKALRVDDKDALISEIEEFIKYILKQEPGRIGLHICLAIIYKHKEKYEKSREHLNYYLELSNNSLSSNYILKLCDQLNIARDQKTNNSSSVS